jgi:hypothetical protein
VATRVYTILTDTDPANFVADLPTKQLALDTALDQQRPVFVQQYINGKMAASWTPAELSLQLSK